MFPGIDLGKYLRTLWGFALDLHSSSWKNAWMPQGFSWSELNVDPARVLALNDVPLPPGRRDFVLYWCMVNHRATHNAALDVALALGNHLALPVLCYHALRPDYPYASDRIHGFVLEGLGELAASMEARGVPYWLELPHDKAAHAARFAALGRRAAAVVTDLSPAFIIPGHQRGAARVLEVPFFAVDASCVVPMQRIAERQLGAYTLRPKLKKLWPGYLRKLPPGVPARHADQGRKVHLELPRVKDPDAELASLAAFDIDHGVARVTDRRGGREAALLRLRAFLDHDLPRYADARNAPSDHVQSSLSPALHFGTLYAGEVAEAALARYGANDPNVESFLEELLVRRELSFNYCLYTPVKQQLSVTSLPRWAQETLQNHGKDAHEATYSFEQLDRGETHDGLWNAAQRELREEGCIHNYLRMLWGKKVLEWSPTPEEALGRMARMNDRYALDGRDPNSVANFMWVLGLHDRPFAERPVLGKVRPMSSFRTLEKSDLGPYLKRYGDGTHDAKSLKLQLKTALAKPRA